MRGRRHLSLALAVAALAAAGCGGDDENEPKTEVVSPELISEAVENTRQAGGVAVRIRSQSTNDSAPDGRKVTVTGSGVIDLGIARGSLAVDMTELGELVEEASGGGQADPDDFKGEYYVDEYRLYTRVPFLTKAAGIEERWLVANALKPPPLGPEGVDFSMLQRINGSDLPQTFEDLLHLVNARRVGEEEVAGVRAKRYEATVNLGETAFGPAFASLTGSDRYRVKVWIADDGLVRKVAWTVKHRTATSDPNVLQNAVRTVEVTLERFRQKVTSKPPPKKDTVDQSKYGLALP